ncbi:unnamed protein product [Durusdinium trenchii]|uniref:Uncharacterized protein n=1 Tax=Durusdinium trenchii TaxID=1381693 RepID=A0ABP0P206_9DINO
MSPGAGDAGSNRPAQGGGTDAEAKKTEAQKEQARPKRPKWRLCFRLDRRMATAKESLEDLAPKYQRDFFLTVIDPPWHGIFKDHPPAPFFASRSACHVADLMASRHMISQLPGRSYEGKAVCVIGAECMTAGLVCAMLGAKVMFVCERNLESYFQHNVRLFRRDTLDYTKTKGKTLLVTSCSPGRNASFGAAALCEKLQVPSIDMIVLTELSAARVLGDVGGLLGRRTEATASGFFRMLNNLVPARSCCKTLVVCDQSSAEIMEEPRFKGDASISTSTAPSWLDENVPPGLAAVLPMDWQARTFCQLPQNIQVIWLERPDAEVVRQRPAPLVNRPPMPPMGATSSRCGCGGHLQSPLLGQRVENKEWFVKNAQLKEALMTHNSLKQMEANSVLREARAWADSVSLSKTATSTTSLLRKEPTAGQPTGAVSPVGKLGKVIEPLSARNSRELRETSRITSSKGSRSARGPNIAERHAAPPVWYNCNRAVYGRPPEEPKAPPTT